MRFRGQERRGMCEEKGLGIGGVRRREGFGVRRNVTGKREREIERKRGREKDREAKFHLFLKGILENTKIRFIIQYFS